MWSPLGRVLDSLLFDGSGKLLPFIFHANFFRVPNFCRGKAQIKIVLILNFLQDYPSMHYFHCLDRWINFHFVLILTRTTKTECRILFPCLDHSLPDNPECACWLQRNVHTNYVHQEQFLISILSTVFSRQRFSVDWPGWAPWDFRSTSLWINYQINPTILGDDHHSISWILRWHWQTLPRVSGNKICTTVPIQTQVILKLLCLLQ